MASCAVMFLLIIKKAATMVAERLIPAWQWTITWPIQIQMKPIRSTQFGGSMAQDLPPVFKALSMKSAAS